MIGVPNPTASAEKELHGPASRECPLTGFRGTKEEDKEGEPRDARLLVGPQDIQVTKTHQRTAARGEEASERKPSGWRSSARHQRQAEAPRLSRLRSPFEARMVQDYTFADCNRKDVGFVRETEARRRLGMGKRRMPAQLQHDNTVGGGEGAAVGPGGEADGNCDNHPVQPQEVECRCERGKLGPRQRRKAGKQASVWD